MPTLSFLGTADSKGVPRFWCACPVCVDARAGGQPGGQHGGQPGETNRRTRSAALIRGGEEALLLDCGPDLHAQLARLPGPLVPEAVLISHAHNDHLLGLGDLLDYVSYAGGRLRVYAPAAVLPDIEARFGYAFRRTSPVQPLPQEGLEVAGVRVRAFPVPHGANGHSHAFRLDRPGLAAAYVSDALDISADVVRLWLADLDLLILGTSFADESGVTRERRSVYDVLEAVALPWAAAARRVYLTHLSHGVDVRTLPLPQGWACAHDGLEIPL